MDWTDIGVIVLVVGAVVVTAVYYAASRIDRMHRRVDRAWDSLGLQLTRKASVALDLAHAQVWDPVTSIVVGSAARAAFDASPRAVEQSELTEALRQALGGPEQIDQVLADPDRAPDLRDLAAVWYRAQLARRFYNEAVAQTFRLRSRRTVRWFHLAGRTPMPQTCDIDDAPPAGLDHVEAPSE
jgi:hypothetical protein